MRVDIEIGQIAVDAAAIGSAPETLRAVISDQIAAHLRRGLPHATFAAQTVSAQVADHIVRSLKP